MMIKNNIVPTKRVRDISFGTCSADLLHLGYKEDVAAYSEITEWHSYTREDGITCYVENDELICIACWNNCFLGIENIIGIDGNLLLDALGEPDKIGEPIWVDDDTQQIPYEYRKLGLQVWFENGIVVSVFCDSGS
ncbi:MAG: hypothetical protein RL748_2505 [Pseudomonadota bacterium]